MKIVIGVAVATKVIDRLGLTEEEFQRFKRACRRTWQAIGGDILTDRESIPRSHVIEVVLDADYILTYGDFHGKEWQTFYKERLSPWVSRNYDTAKFKKLMKEVFSFERYGN